MIEMDITPETYYEAKCKVLQQEVDMLHAAVSHLKTQLVVYSDRITEANKASVPPAETPVSVETPA